MNYFIRVFCLIFILLFSISLPFPLQFIEHPGFLVEDFFVFFEQITCYIFGLKYEFQGHFYSDSIDLIIHLIFVAFLSILVSSIIWKFKKNIKIDLLLTTVSSYILSFFLIKYGFDKVFKMQFYAPEPNILYTPFGQLDKDILYWSTIGKSYSYNLFLGIIEIIPGILLLHKKTRKLGTFISFGILINVLMVNISYQIEVKILSSFLIFLSLCILSNYWKEFLMFFTQNKDVEIKKSESFKIPIRLKRFLKFIIIFYIFFESTFLGFSTGNLNDDLDKRPKFHGAYKIQNSSISISKLFHVKSKIKRFFVHRRYYFIIQTEDDQFHDYPIHIKEHLNYIVIDSPQKIKIHFKKSRNSYFIKLETNKDTIGFQAIKLQ